MPMGRAIVMACLLAGGLATGSPAGAEDGHPLAAPAPGPAAPPAETSFDVALSPAARHAEIPWAQLSPDAYTRVRDVVRDATLSHQMRGITFRSRKAVFEYLLDHPDFAADLTRALRQGKYRVRRVGDAYETDDGHGARGLLTPVFADGGRRLFHLAGRFESAMLPTLKGQLVVLLDAEHVDGPDGVTYCEMRFAGHLRLESAAADLVVSVMQRLGSVELDRKVGRFFRHVAVVSRRAYDDPEGLADELARWPGLPADRVAEMRALLLAGLPPGWSERQQFRLLDDSGLSDGGE